MSQSSTIEITARLIKNVNIIEIIDKFNSIEFTLDYYGKICYLPKGDNLMFNWTFKNLSEEQTVKNEIQNIFKDSNDVVGITLFNKKLDSGFNLLIFSDSDNHRIVFQLLNPILIEQNDCLVDFSWYLKTIFFKIQNLVDEMVSIECETA